jgi:hypothetical protein
MNIKSVHKLSPRIKLSFFVIGILLLGVFITTLSVRQRHETQSHAATSRPLRVLASNPRYFSDGSGRAIYLTGSHTWDNLQDSGEIGKSINTFDYNAFLNLMTSHNHNFMRMWAWEGGVNNSYYDLLAYVRTSSGKYDLNQFNQSYFDRLRSRVMAARDRGIYVGIMLFQGWSIYSHGYGNPWPLHPYNSANNITGINCDPNGDGEGQEVHSLQVPAITDLQKAYIRKVVDTVNDLDNVLYEITNESWHEGYSWQNEMVRYIKEYESSKSIQHPVGMTYFDSGGQGSNTDLFNSLADWISPASQDGLEYDDNPSPGDGRKVIIVDTDHLNGTTRPGSWFWKSFIRGLNPILMDAPENSEKEEGRVAMGQTLTYANKMNLAAMTPQGNLSSTGYALAAPGAEYLVYQPGEGSFSVDLQDATYEVEWFNPSNSQTSSGGSVSGGGSQTLTPPFSGGPAVLYLKNSSITGIPVQGGDCHLYTSQTPLFQIPLGFGVPWDVLVQGLLILNVKCETASAQFMVGTGNTYQYIWPEAYVSKEGAAWEKITLSGTPVSSSVNWLVGSANGNISGINPSSTNWLAAYVCTWPRGSEG